MSGGSTVAKAFARRTAAERRLLVSVAFLFLSAHGLLRLCSLRRARGMLRSLAAMLRIVAGDAEQLTWCVDRVHHRLPGRHSCLINAMVGDAVAAASGIPVEFRIGAARSEAGHRFHAWVDCEGHTIIGIEHAHFVPFAKL